MEYSTISHYQVISQRLSGTEIEHVFAVVDIHRFEKDYNLDKLHDFEQALYTSLCNTAKELEAEINFLTVERGELHSSAGTKK